MQKLTSKDIEFYSKLYSHFRKLKKQIKNLKIKQSIRLKRNIKLVHKISGGIIKVKHILAFTYTVVVIFNAPLSCPTGKASPFRMFGYRAFKSVRSVIRELIEL